MRTLATKQPINDVVKQKHGGKGRGRSISPLSTGMPMLQRQCACGGSCPRCQDELGIQTKLKISEPGDKYEQEADRIADEVMRMPEPSVQQKIEPEEEEGIVQRKALSNPTLGSEIPSIVREAVNSSAHPLDSKTRSLMEYRFGHDFSQVRLHIGTKATQSAQAVGALAYTLGHHIVVDADRYAPETAEGQRLLAHELVHVLQQSPLILENGTFEVTPGAEQLQRAIPQGLVIAAGIIAAIAACASPWYFYAMRTYSGKTDKWRHCYVSCQMSKTCGPILTELAGLGKEIRDRAVAAYCGDNQTSWLCQGGHGDFLDSLRDLAANQTCIAWEAAIVGPLARLWRESCFDCCNRAGL